MFDRFWNHPLAVPMDAFRKSKDAPDLETARAEFEANLREALDSIYAESIGSPFVTDMTEGRITLYPATAEVITDDPEKLLNQISLEHQTLVTHMAQVVAAANTEVIVVTPYFIPGPDGIDFWRRLTERGVRVVIVTNSLASNNHIPVHAAYTRYRRPLIRAGVELRETRVDAIDGRSDNNERNVDSVTLHTKAMAIDGRYTFIGSLNLDPRSIDINTEMGVLVDSPALTKSLRDPFFASLPERTYLVSEDHGGNLSWQGVINGEAVIEQGEPQAGSWRKVKAFFSRILPEGQL
jgi:putative cardiolipin synthase